MTPSRLHVALSPRMLHAVTLVGFSAGLFGCIPTAAVEKGHPVTVAVQKGIAHGSKTFSHSDYDALLKKHVVADGRVDYLSLVKEHAKLKAYLDRLAAAPLTDLGRDELFALFINAYNAYTLDVIVRHYPLESIKKISPWKTESCRIGGEKVSLDFIEHKLLRVDEIFGDPRMHFAINCASIGCPPLRSEAYTGQRISEQLDRAVRDALKVPRYLTVEDGRVEVSKILSWFRDDFVKKHGSLSKFLEPYVSGKVLEILKTEGDAAIAFQDYDWNLNDKPRK